MFLKNTSYYNANDITKIVEEDNDYIYYHDNLNRRCYIEKGLEGIKRIESGR